MSEFASAHEVALLGQGVLAVRVQGGKVPARAIGLSLASGVAQHYLPDGKTVSAPRHGVLWWLHEGQQTMRCAPMPGAPEAGLALTLQLHLINDLTTDALHQWLLQQDSVVTTATLANQLCGHPDLQFPPCPTSEELERAKRNLKRNLWDKIGWRCLDLALCDLYPEVNLAKQRFQGQADAAPARPATDAASATSATTSTTAASAASPLPQDIGQGDAAPATGMSASDFIAQPGPGMPARPSSLPMLLAQDAAYEMRLFHELPKLAQAMRKLPWPENNDHYEQHQAMLWRLEHLAATSGRLPGLASRLQPQKLPPGRIGLLCAESQRAAHTLDQLWNTLDTMAEAGPLGQYAQLERILQAIEVALARRKQPWWECK
jgi:hypothetical protein